MALAVVNFRSYVLFSLALAAAVVGHAAFQKRFFYRTMVHLSESKLAIFTAANLALVSVVVVWKTIQKIFLGPLRFREVERLNTRARDAIIECCFATTIFREEVDLIFLALVTTLLMLKSLHWLTKDRMDFLEEQPLSPRIAHVRLVGLMTLLFVSDQYLVWECTKSLFQTRDGTMLVLFAFEFTVLLIDLSSDFVRYVFHVIDLRMDGRWDDKGLYSFYNELVTDMCQLTIYLAFFLYVNTYYTFPLHILRDVYITFTKFQRRCSDFIRYRRVVSTMNVRFPDATEEELSQGDRTCIICREEMPEAKKLACGHMFHARCLQSWLKRQLSCPTCRSNVDVNPISANNARAPQPNAAPHPNDGRVPPPPDDNVPNRESFWQQANRLWQHVVYGAPREGVAPAPPPEHIDRAPAGAQQQQQRPGIRRIFPNIRFGLRVERRRLNPQQWVVPPPQPAAQNDAPPPLQVPQLPPMPPGPPYGDQAPPMPDQLPVPPPELPFRRERDLGAMPAFPLPTLPNPHNMPQAHANPMAQHAPALDQLIAIQENIGVLRAQLDSLRDQVERLVVDATDAMVTASIEQMNLQHVETAPDTEPQTAVVARPVVASAASSAASVAASAPKTPPSVSSSSESASRIVDSAAPRNDKTETKDEKEASEQEDLRQKRLAFLDKGKSKGHPASSSRDGPAGPSNSKSTRANAEDWM